MLRRGGRRLPYSRWIRSGASEATRAAGLAGATCGPGRQARNGLEGWPLALAALCGRGLQRLGRGAALDWRLAAGDPLEGVAGERFELDERFGKAVEHVAVIGDDLDRLLVALVDQAPNFLVDGLGGLLGV